MTCPLCDEPCRTERLADGWRLCGKTFLAYHVDDKGRVLAWATTNKSHPRGVTAIRVDVPDGRGRAPAAGHTGNPGL